MIYQIKTRSKSGKMAQLFAENLGTNSQLKPWTSSPGLKIGSFAVYPLSLQSMVDLKLAGNAFFTGGQIIEGDIAAYIWRHMPEYDRSDPKFEKSLKCFLREAAKEKNPQGLADDIQAHIEAAFADATELAPIAGIVSEFAQIYGLNPVEAAYTDLRIVFQTLKARRTLKASINN